MILYFLVMNSKMCCFVEHLSTVKSPFYFLLESFAIYIIFAFPVKKLRSIKVIQGKTSSLIMLFRDW